MENKKGYEMTSLNPGWIKKSAVECNWDDDLKKLIIFYVINTPCVELSFSGIALSEYGWDKDIWKNNNLKDYLYGVAGLTVVLRLLLQQK